jgi:dienelactone hydrolase
MKQSHLNTITCAVLAAGIFASATARAEIRTQNIDYKVGNDVFEGFIAYDDAIKDKRPGILIAHNKRGISKITENIAIKLAKLGYVAFAADSYGKGIRFTKEDDDGSTVQSQKLKKDRALTRARIQAALDVLTSDSHVDTSKLGVSGYCLGGMVALELARSGAPIKAVAIFHGTLDSPTPEDAKNIKGRVLVMHGIDDTSVPVTDAYKLANELKAANVNFQLELYSGVLHGFTEPENKGGPGKKTIYNERADQKSWAAMQDLFHDAFDKNTTGAAPN